MNRLSRSTTVAENQIASGNNKPDQELVQDLLKSIGLLNSVYLFIDSNSKKGFRTIDKTKFQPLLRPTYLSEWLCNVTMLFLSLFNKTKAYFLIHKTLSIAHDTS